MAAVAGAAFAGVSWATSASTGDPDLPSWLPAASLPTVTVPTDDQLAINNLISIDDASAYGITTGSYANARILTQTDLGPLYVIPGTNGICLALTTPAVACTNDLSRRGPAVVALLVPNASGQLVGGGLIATKGSAVSVIARDGSLVPTHPTPGGFFVGSSDNITATPEDTIGLAAG